MKNFRLARIIGLIDDDLVTEAAGVKKRYLRRITRWMSMVPAACLCIVIIMAVVFGNHGMGSSAPANGAPMDAGAVPEAPEAADAPAEMPAGDAEEAPEVNGIGPNADPSEADGAAIVDNSSTFMYYTGPILPLSLEVYSDGVTAEREITLDFSPYVMHQVVSESDLIETYSNECLIIDNYILTNNTDSDINCTALYPFIVSFQPLEDNSVKIYADNAPVETLAYPEICLRDMDGFDSSLYGVYGEMSVSYEAFELKIPAGESVIVSVRLRKAASYGSEHSGENEGLNGFDLAAALGSNLEFTSQKATLEDRGIIEIVNQNFGFDIENGIKTVELDLDTERYYLEILRKSQDS